MAKFKSLGLAGAKRAGEATTKALRKLFGRQNSTGAEGSEGAAAGSSDRQIGSGSGSNDDDAAAAAATGTGGAGATTASPSQRQLTSDSSPNTTQNSNQDTSSATKPTDNPTTTSQGHTTNDTTMQSTLGKENLPPGTEPGKENEPPKSDVKNFALGMKKLDLGDSSPKKEIIAPAPILPVTPIEEEVRPLTPDELLSPEERAFRQERRKHLVFIEEALDMVRYPPLFTFARS